MIPRAIAAPIFPAPIMPIVSFNIAMPPSLRITNKDEHGGAKAQADVQGSMFQVQRFNSFRTLSIEL
jgi:hypothetical protein